MANIVLVHGLWVDGSSWRAVSARLQQHGHQVTAVQLPLSSLSDAVAVVRRVLDGLDGDIVLVGHSYGGMVISGAGTGDAKVEALIPNVVCQG
ncbi:esterase/lipase family protein [Streptacidiphilus rugosus]|uniref:esterase/lipase family protein n=1 Tax=Streptacidiphilus rugosus TaxID=405783 RepID=UPI00068D1244|nr:alpha/beta hydrolase [Streptacidiphilus rugosus]